MNGIKYKNTYLVHINEKKEGYIKNSIKKNCPVLEFDIHLKTLPLYRD